MGLFLVSISGHSTGSYGNRQPDDIRRIAAEVVGWLRTST